MSTQSFEIEKGKQVIRIEAQSLTALVDKIDASFERAVRIIFEAKGRIVVTGMGKSGIIARKIVATMNSTGTPAIFLHASDAVHGDLGMVRREDVVVCLSKSGETQEICQLISIFKRIQVPIIAILGRVNSSIAKESDVVLDVSVEEEACPHDLAPTSSTTAALAMEMSWRSRCLKKGTSARKILPVSPGWKSWQTSSSEDRRTDDRRGACSESLAYHQPARYDS